MRRLIFPALAVLGFVALATAVVWMAALAFAAAQQRSQEYRYLSDALSVAEQPADAVIWTPPNRVLVRNLSRGDETLVGSAMTKAWRAFTAASDTGEAALLADHFSGIALSRAQLAAQQSYSDGTRMVVLEQTARPEFLHLDGSILQLSAKAMTVRFALRDGLLGQFDLTHDGVLTTLTNETTGWRIFSHERTGSRKLVAADRPLLALSPLAGVNYYPARTPWRRFWPEYDPEVIAADLDLLVGLGGNALRIFLPVRDFGPDAEGAANLVKLENFLAIAQAKKIRVIPTLFDLKPGYLPALWADDIAYLRRVLPVLAGSDAVVLVDLKNEPDLDRAENGAGLVDAWLSTVTLMSREIAPDLALTIGWSSAEAAPHLAAMLDAVSYHDYADVGGTADRLAQVREKSLGKPVLVTEVGASSYELALGLPGSPGKQARVLQDRMAQLSRADGVLIWTLHDFAAPDVEAVGASPWRQRLQAQFGLYDSTGAAKPAAEVAAKTFLWLRDID